LLLGGTFALEPVSTDGHSRVVGTISLIFENSRERPHLVSNVVVVVAAVTFVAVLDRAGNVAADADAVTDGSTSFRPLHIGHESRSFGIFVVTFRKQSTSFGIIQTTFRKRNNQE
jgi:hypothetical protein